MQSILLGIVQGLTEFLPVSSSGHLVLAQALLGNRPAGGIVFEVAVHLAILLAILLFYRRRVWSLTGGLICGDTSSRRFAAKLVVGTLPAVVLALTAREWLERQFESIFVVGLCLLATGCIVWTTRYTGRKARSLEPTWLAALLIGCGQAVAMLPGISRSGTTVAVALALGVAPVAAAEFSFLLGVIAIAGAGVLLLPELSAVSAPQLKAIAIGGIAALASGLGAIWLFVRLLRGKQFHWFAWYAWAVGLLTLTVVLRDT